MEVSGQFHAPAALSPGKILWYPLDWRLGGAQSRSGRGGEEKNSQPLPELEPPIIQPVAQCYTTELSRLLITREYKILVGVSKWKRSLGRRMHKWKDNIEMDLKGGRSGLD
jgi:hypothetical protein